MREGKLYIDGRWVRSSSRKKFISLNPATGKSFGRYEAGNKKDVDKAVNASSRALAGWKKTPAPKRAEILYETVRLLKKNKDWLRE